MDGGCFFIFFCGDAQLQDKGQWAQTGNKNKLYFEDDRALGQAVQRGCVSSLQIFKIYLCTCNLLQGTCFSSEVVLDDLHKSLPTPMILRFCDSVSVGKS